MDMRRRAARGRQVGWAVLLALGLSAAVKAQDDPPGRVGRLAVVQGEAQVFDADEGRWVAALPNRPFTQHDRLATGGGGRVEVRIGSTTLFVAGGSELDASRLDDERMQFALLRGSVALRVRAAEVAAETEVVTPEGRFGPRRAGLYRVDRRDETSLASVWRGELQLSARGLELTLQPGERVDLWFDAARGVMRSERLPPLSDDFALDVLRDDLAAAGEPVQPYVSPEMTGAEDLERYGRWQQHPEVGPVWLPIGLAPGWAPYRHGRWVWLRPWGWTWVDDAPWGFAPFHYGRWLWWGGNWCWTPGVRVPRPVYAPALVGWVGPRPGVPGGVVVGVPGGPRVLPAPVWVPLAPREPFHPWYHASPGYLGRVNGRPPGPPATPPPAWQNRHVPGATSTVPRETVAPRAVIPVPAPRAGESPVTGPGHRPGGWPAPAGDASVPGAGGVSAGAGARPPSDGRRPGAPAPAQPMPVPPAPAHPAPAQAAPGQPPPVQLQPVQSPPAATGPFGGPVPPARAPRVPSPGPAANGTPPPVVAPAPGAAPAVPPAPAPPASPGPVTTAHPRVPAVAPVSPAAAPGPAAAVPPVPSVAPRKPEAPARPAAEPGPSAGPEADPVPRRQPGGRLAPRER